MTQRGRQRPGWNPTRRNRNIGTAKQGRGQNNRMVIPRPRPRELEYYECINSYVEIIRRIHGRVIHFVVERPRKNIAYAVTVDDVARMLWMIPKSDYEGLKLVVFRQPTRKQDLLWPVWGRIGFDARVGRFAGPAIFLDAADSQREMTWGRKLDPDNLEELGRLRADGFRITEVKRGFAIQGDFESIRNTQLYRTIPHEIGHWVDWSRTVLQPSGGDPMKIKSLANAYFSRPKADRERFAHRYAEEFCRRLRRIGDVPFPRQFDLKQIRKDNLRAVDFGVPSMDDEKLK